MNAITGSEPVTLVSHPQSSSQAVRGIDAVATLAPGGILTLAFVLEGDLTLLRIPEPRTPRRTDGLWRHTCFEVFVMAEAGPGYRELNLSPSGAWAAFAFSRYREGVELAIERPPGLVVRRTVDRLELEAQICPDFLPPDRPLSLGLCAVVEDTDGVLSYWALRHPAGRPDFHHTDAFALPIA